MTRSIVSAIRRSAAAGDQISQRVLDLCAAEQVPLESIRSYSMGTFPEQYDLRDGRRIEAWSHTARLVSARDAARDDRALMATRIGDGDGFRGVQ